MNKGQLGGGTKEEKKNVVFIKQKRSTLTGVYSLETFFPLLDYKTVLFLASQGFARIPYQSHSSVL